MHRDPLKYALNRAEDCEFTARLRVSQGDLQTAAFYQGLAIDWRRRAAELSQNKSRSTQITA